MRDTQHGTARALLLVRDDGITVSVNALIALDALGTVLSVLATAVFAACARREVRVRESRVMTPFNIALAVMGAAISLLFAASLVLHFTADPVVAKVLQVFQTTCVSTAELCYVFYSWNRGWCMLELSSRRIYKVAKRVVAALPLIVLSPVIVSIIGEFYNIDIMWLRGSITFSGASVALFDLMIISVFLASLRKNLNMQSVKTDMKLGIICSYGVAASVMMLVSLSALTAVLSAPISMSLRLTLVWICDIFLLGCYSMLVLLKIALYHYHIKLPSVLKLPLPSHSEIHAFSQSDWPINTQF